jgi:hypothetical protein
MVAHPHRWQSQENMMRKLDVIAAVLLVVGA